MLMVSYDLPFALTPGSTNSTTSLENVGGPLSHTTRRFRAITTAYRSVEGPLAGMFSRAVVVLDENNTVVYREQIPDIVSTEPDYKVAAYKCAWHRNRVRQDLEVSY